MATWPTPDQIETFLSGPADQPVVMMNLLTFNDTTTGGDGTGREAVLRYGTAMRQFVESRGGNFVFAGDVDSQLIGEGGENFHFVSIMRYPSRQSFLDLAGDPDIAWTIGQHRDAGLQSQWLLAMTEVES